MACNTDICKAACCTKYPMLAPINPQILEWLEAKGTPFKQSKTHVIFHLDNGCQHLTKDLKCDLHGTVNKPEVCASDSYFQSLKAVCKVSGFEFSDFIGGDCTYSK